jgi:hypothetical protein
LADLGVKAEVADELAGIGKAVNVADGCGLDPGRALTLRF